MIGRLYYLKVVWGGVYFITKSHLEKIIFVDQSWIWPMTNFLIDDAKFWKSIVLNNFLRKEFGFLFIFILDTFFRDTTCNRNVQMPFLKVNMACEVRGQTSI